MRRQHGPWTPLGRGAITLWLLALGMAGCGVVGDGSSEAIRLACDASCANLEAEPCVDELQACVDECSAVASTYDDECGLCLAQESWSNSGCEFFEDGECVSGFFCVYEVASVADTCASVCE